ncbi:hypothetical protein RDWZM_006496 [Blomia tropicalis]|uniref:Uncharacterized protein n=1 Tax=Blomia tropicalis TaxID=40697 RepID=A0A9Q0M8D5_BLOTA|nr:hypothetical protein RDWZM_006496 [Blomia tropicalis]
MWNDLVNEKVDATKMVLMDTAEDGATFRNLNTLQVQSCRYYGKSEYVCRAGSNEIKEIQSDGTTYRVNVQILFRIATKYYKVRAEYQISKKRTSRNRNEDFDDEFPIFKL